MPGCSKRYTDPSSLRKHVKIHSKEEQDKYKEYRERNLAVEQHSWLQEAALGEQQQCGVPPGHQDVPGMYIYRTQDTSQPNRRGNTNLNFFHIDASTSNFIIHRVENNGLARL